MRTSLSGLSASMAGGAVAWVACGPPEVSLEDAARAELDAQANLYAKHLAKGAEVAVRADEPVNTLSIIKIPIMVLAYRDAEAGRLDLDERYTIRPEDMRLESGLLRTFTPGLAPTWRSIVTQMIITSDNTATDIMIARLGSTGSTSCSRSSATKRRGCRPRPATSLAPSGSWPILAAPR